MADLGKALGRDRLVGSRSRSIGSTGSAMIDWSNPDPDPSDLDPSNPAPGSGAGLTGSIGSKCDLCAYMVGKNHFYTHCRTSSGLLLTFRTTRAISTTCAFFG